MRKVLLLSFALLMGIMLSAQTQQGYVKTKGRMVDGKLIPGQGLKGASVSVHGRNTILVNSNDGTFSFPVPDAQFRLDSVRKKGYQLVDMDALSKTYKHSQNPIYLVMETPEQMIEDRMENFEKINSAQQKLISTLRAEVKKLKTENRLTEEEYSKRLQEIADMQTESQQLVNDMVERYSKIDFDQLSESDQKISELILNGELTKADSMLRTKGNIIERAKLFKKDETAIAKEKAGLSQRQEKLKQSEDLIAKRLEDLANDCYQKFEICKMRHEIDSAAYYIELRSSLDSMNIEWMCDVGSFVEEYMAQYNCAMNYYMNALSKVPPSDSSTYAVICNDIGSLFKTLGEYDKALEYYKLSMDYLENTNYPHFIELANLYHSLGNLYNNLTENSKALHYYLKALALYEIGGEECIGTAKTYSSMGTLYLHIDKYDTAIVYFNKALETCITLYGNKHPEAANIIYNNLGAAYFYQGEYDKAIEYYEKSKDIKEKVYKEDHPTMALMYNNMGEVFAMQGKFEKSISYLRKSIEIYCQVYGEKNWHVAAVYRNLGEKFIRMADYGQATTCYKTALNIAIFCKRKDIEAECYNGLGLIQNELGNYDVSIDYFDQALALDSILFGPNSLEAAYVYHNMSSDYYEMDDYEKGITLAKKALKIRIESLGDNHPEVIQSYNAIAFAYFHTEDYPQCIEYFTKALNICRTKNNINHKEVASTLSNIGLVYLKSSDYPSAINAINEAINIYTSVFGDMFINVGLCYHDLGDAYYELGDFNTALDCYEKSLKIKISNLGENHEKVVLTRQKIAEVQSKLKEQENE